MDVTNPEYEEGKAHLRAREFAEAAAAFQRLLATRPDDAEAWQFLGAARSQTREWPTAVAAFRKAAALDPSVRNRYNLAVALKEGLGRNDEAHEGRQARRRVRFRFRQAGANGVEGNRHRGEGDEKRIVSQPEPHSYLDRVARRRIGSGRGAERSLSSASIE